MNSLFRDRRLHYLLAANTLSSIGTGMTMIAIPWLFVQKHGGETTFGIITTTLTVIMFLLTPTVGMWIDRVSRKTLLLVGEASGGIIVSLFALIGTSGNEYYPWQLAVLFASGSLYYFLFYPTMFAFTQEIFEREQYEAVNGMTEIQGQLATVVSGGLASVMIGKVPFHWLLWLDASTYLVAFFCLSLISYRRTRQVTTTASFWNKLTEGYRYMQKHPALFWFFLASFMPFIGVMMTNYLHPIYIADILQKDSSVYGIQSMVYGIGAALAGAIVPFFVKRMGATATIVLNVGIYAFGVTMFLVLDEPFLFYMFVIFTAFGNAGARVARSSLMMAVVPNDKIGRVDSLFRAIGFMIRFLLLSAFTGLVSTGHILIPYSILSGLLFLALWIVLKLAAVVNKSNISEAS
ncbi:MFS family permease [Anoxybacillus voinovskiensis]|uniref:MFS family permease n=1 Tax=Anoxybacteroides voinovskiense TaxID=230470 RepID=A0A840DNX9_9BACL|nr:MFS transporter [Anoxybacillus voinovskiensis]MBB4074784.1 MFS family permease [Anoxybacillus voinovskiensis]GGJ73481.1 MFS transporter [Anoxybacillus voinovskiensis]